MSLVRVTKTVTYSGSDRGTLDIVFEELSCILYTTVAISKQYDEDTSQIGIKNSANSTSLWNGHGTRYYQLSIGGIVGLASTASLVVPNVVTIERQATRWGALTLEFEVIGLSA